MKRFENGIEFDSLRERLGFEGMLSSMKECLNNYTKIKKKAGIFIPDISLILTRDFILSYKNIDCAHRMEKIKSEKNPEVKIDSIAFGIDKELLKICVELYKVVDDKTVIDDLIKSASCSSIKIPPDANLSLED